MEYTAKAYLESNAVGRWDGARKAEMHQLLCLKFVMEHFSFTRQYTERVRFKDNSLTSLIRLSTLPLTDYLDEVIGFPLDKAPNYKKLVPLFLAKFRELATEYIDNEVSLMTLDETRELMDELKHNTFNLMLPALESYDFEFIDGEGNKFLKMKSPLGIEVTITPNTFFGCSYELVGVS